MFEVDITILQMIATIFMSLDYFAKRHYIKKSDIWFDNLILVLKNDSLKSLYKIKESYNKKSFAYNFIVFSSFIICTIAAYVLFHMPQYNINDNTMNIILFSFLISMFVFMISTIYLFNMVFVYKIAYYGLSIFHHCVKLFSRKGMFAAYGLLVLFYSFVLAISNNLNVYMVYDFFNLLTQIIYIFSSILLGYIFKNMIFSKPKFKS